MKNENKKIEDINLEIEIVGKKMEKCEEVWKELGKEMNELYEKLNIEKQ